MLPGFSFKYVGEFEMSKSGKIWVWILVGILIVLIVGTVGGYFALRLARRKATDAIQKKTAQMIAPAREKFLKMLPEDYDKEKAKKVFDSFIIATQKGRVRVNMVLTELAPYLQEAISDGKLSSYEADSVLKLMKKTIMQ